ncbi:uncharacterized protein LAESUDRAFT_528771 [Laetiporus sulphureus 93-53]|uniref:Uncharacterized protein n=1 Tax=Laetiporus sulphureus 93-53 TaxID=1314785 RepID=A0A165BBP7_9APHY|nr:uncharacterized protein LAESUDRAFT_528771 [Laetiporus sulphureus 93-53]KZT00688.1 hypothetical protein LAESUDRAFT_528771 [Laetiporus sulphureus 93-53]
MGDDRHCGIVSHRVIYGGDDVFNAPSGADLNPSRVAHPGKLMGTACRYPLCCFRRKPTWEAISVRHVSSKRCALSGPGVFLSRAADEIAARLTGASDPERRESDTGATGSSKAEMRESGLKRGGRLDRALPSILGHYHQGSHRHASLAGA